MPKVSEKAPGRLKDCTNGSIPDVTRSGAGRGGPEQVAPKADEDKSDEAQECRSKDASGCEVCEAAGADSGHASLRIGRGTPRHARSATNTAKTLPEQAVPSTGSVGPSRAEPLCIGGARPRVAKPRASTERLRQPEPCGGGREPGRVQSKADKEKTGPTQLKPSAGVEVPTQPAH